MILRIWRGRTPADRADEYLEYLKETGVNDYGAVRGNRGVKVLRRIERDEAEFVVMSMWDSVDAIRKFAGDDYEHAVYYPQDADFLLELDPRVAHYAVILEHQHRRQLTPAP